MVMLKKNKDFLTYTYRKLLLKVYPKLCITLQVLLTCPAVSVAGAERSFSKLKLIKIFHRSTMIDERYYVISMIFIERACAQDLDLYHIVNVIAAEKAGRKTI